MTTDRLPMYHLRALARAWQDAPERLRAAAEQQRLWDLSRASQRRWQEPSR